MVASQIAFSIEPEAARWGYEESSLFTRWSTYGRLPGPGPGPCTAGVLTATEVIASVA